MGHVYVLQGGFEKLGIKPSLYHGGDKVEFGICEPVPKLVSRSPNASAHLQLLSTHG